MTIALRPWKISDLDRLVQLADNPKIAANLMDRFPHPYTREAGENFINMAISSQPESVLSILVDNEVAGGIGVHPQQDVYRKNAELGYWLAEEYWGKGIITEAIKLILPYAFENFDINRIFARPFGGNIASQKVLEKNGFHLEATLSGTFFKNGQYLDELIYGIRR
jgi:ribosomal-protein-alanine N-acetyltransferase